MGMPYEMNWFLVVSSEENVHQINTKCFSTVKNEKRIYPVESPIPYIIKTKGCLGLVKIKSFKISDQITEIEFEISEKFDDENPIALHYYNLYKSKET